MQLICVHFYTLHVNHMIMYIGITDTIGFTEGLTIFHHLFIHWKRVEGYI